jgi:hypothetical protein
MIMVLFSYKKKPLNKETVVNSNLMYIKAKYTMTYRYL